MSEWSNVLDSILDSIPVVSAPASPVKVTLAPSNKVRNLDYDAPVTADMLREAGLATNPAPIAEPTDPAPLPPMRNHTGKPALPADRWVDFATLAEALQARRQLSAQHATACGLDGETGRYYVRGYGWQWAPI